MIYVYIIMAIAPAEKVHVTSVQGPVMRLDSASGVPLYRQIVVILGNRIATGVLRPGETVPGETAICEEFGVSRITAQRALNELSAEGLVVRERGRGTRVVEKTQPPIMKASLEGLFENVGHIGRTTTVDVLDFRYLPATPAIAELLDIAEGAPVQRAIRVRRLGEVPMSYLATVVPEDIGRKVEGKDMSRTPLLLLLEEAGVSVASAKQTISATVADAEVAIAMGIHPGAPLIEVERLVFDADDRPIEMIRVLYRPDLYHFEMSMERVGGTWRADASTPLKAVET